MDSGPIPVTRSFIPPVEEYQALIAQIFERGIFTNYGPLVKQLEADISGLLGLPDSIYVGNGTIALQLAIKALGVKGEVITTPYSYVASTSSILWEGCTPIFVDIDPNSFCMDPALIENSITDKTTAILATHVYGVPCQVEMIQSIADRHGLKVIYDGAHAFGTSYKGKSLLSYGDISTVSFHATKIFHTIEGGGIFSEDKRVLEQLRLMRSFGHVGDEHICVGINAKNSEFHAAMGLCNLRYIDQILTKRGNQWKLYYSLLSDTNIQLLSIPDHTEFNYAYFPAVFNDTARMAMVLEALGKLNVYPRRYFYPSLNLLPYLENTLSCPISEQKASTTLCLPLYHTLEDRNIEKICDVILNTN